MKYTTEHNIGQIVAEDYRIASALKAYDIDFCCNGNRTLGAACQDMNIDPLIVINSIQEVTSEHRNEHFNFKLWPPELIADYIEKIHHTYVKEQIPTILQLLEKLQKVHGTKHPELLEIYNQFEASSHDLLAHMTKEENILFPYARLASSGEIKNAPAFGSIQNPITVMMHEHDNEGERFRTIRKLTNDYTCPPDGCTTYKVAFAMLEEFESDLHKHIHLENNILFPKLKEAELLQAV